MLKYELSEELGKGSYATVYKAYLKEDTMKLYPLAVKQIRPDKDDKRIGFQISAIREIYALRRANHPNIMKLYDVFISNGYTNLVYEYLDIGLDSIIRNFRISEAQGKTYFRMLVEGVNYLHNTLSILHLDIAPKNILISYNPNTKESTLKLADFGLSYPYSSSRCVMGAYQCDPSSSPSSSLNPLTSPPDLMEPGAVTLPYRAPELLYGATQYGPPTDMWSCGCIFAEILLGEPLFPCRGGDNIDAQKQIIAERLGTPNDTVWPGFSLFADEAARMGQEQQAQLHPQALMMRPQQRAFPAGRVIEKGRPFSEFDRFKSGKVITRLLSYDPNRRPTASGLLKSSFFKDGCSPLNELPIKI